LNSGGQSFGNEFLVMDSFNFFFCFFFRCRSGDVHVSELMPVHGVGGIAAEWRAALAGQRWLQGAAGRAAGSHGASRLGRTVLGTHRWVALVNFLCTFMNW
jgi:hypothetical protein